jgi:hypothetical protein
MRMSGLRAPLGLMTWLALLAFLLDAGCSRPTGLNGTEGSAATDSRQVPFREADGKGASDSNAASVSPVLDKSAKSESGPPFRDPDNLPAGTLLTVRLKNPVSANNPEASGRFEGVIDEPVTVDGNTLVPRGASVAGRVEAARSSKVHGSGFVRVTLDSIDIAGKDLHLQTSSLFARGNGTGDNAAIGAITLEKGRRLTFRLIEAAYVIQPASPNR